MTLSTDSQSNSSEKSPRAPEPNSLRDFTPIGVARTPYTSRFGTPRQSLLVDMARATIEIFPRGDLNGCLDGLDQFSHVWVLFLFHENTNAKVRGKVHPPRLDGAPMGVFATRSPHRPNPVGLSVVRLDGVSDWSLEVSGVDFIDGTPILDIKPYIPEVDGVSNAHSGWTGKIPPRSLKVEFLPQALEELEHLTSPMERLSVRALIEQTLALDPRPVIYRNDLESRYRSRHAVYLGSLDVHFTVTDQTATVIEIRRA